MRRKRSKNIATHCKNIAKRCKNGARGAKTEQNAAKKLIKVFQMRFRPENVSGILDLETFNISKTLK